MKSQYHQEFCLFLATVIQENVSPGFGSKEIALSSGEFLSEPEESAWGKTGGEMGRKHPELFHSKTGVAGRKVDCL